VSIRATQLHAFRNQRGCQCCRACPSGNGVGGAEQPSEACLASSLTAERSGTAEIMRWTCKSKSTVWRWPERIMTAGVDELLRDKTRPSRVPPLGRELAERVVALTQCDPPGRRRDVSSVVTFVALILDAMRPAGRVNVKPMSDRRVCKAGPQRAGLAVATLPPRLAVSAALHTGGRLAEVRGIGDGLQSRAGQQGHNSQCGENELLHRDPPFFFAGVFVSAATADVCHVPIGTSMTRFTFRATSVRQPRSVAL
jgi:hypothetical protein